MVQAIEQLASPAPPAEHGLQPTAIGATMSRRG